MKLLCSNSLKKVINNFIVIIICYIYLHLFFFSETSEIFQKAVGTANNTGNTSAKDNSRRPQKTSPIKLDRAKSREVVPREIPEGPPLSSEDETPTFQPSTCPANWTDTLSDYDKSLKKPEKDNILRHDSDEETTPVIKKVTKKLTTLDLTGTLEEFDDSTKKKKKTKRRNPDKQKGAETKLAQDKVKKDLVEVVKDVRENSVEDGKSKSAKGGKMLLKIGAIVEKVFILLYKTTFLLYYLSLCGYFSFSKVHWSVFNPFLIHSSSHDFGNLCVVIITFASSSTISKLCRYVTVSI